MTTEQRLAAALQSTGGYEASPDLWRRVVHSIEEDRAHRRRVAAVVTSVCATLAVAIALAALSIESLDGRHRIDWRVVEALEVGIMAGLIVSMGPAIRRFGRGYVGDFFRASPGTGDRLLRLLDVSYYLVFAGFVLLTARLAAPGAYRAFDLGDQIEQAAIRIAGLLLVMGVLHGLTLMAMPLVGLVFNTTRVGARLPRWVVVLLGLVALGVAVLVLPIVVGSLGT